MSGYVNRSAAYSELGQLPAALADSNKAVELQPRNARYRRRRAAGLVMLHQYERAIAMATRSSTSCTKPGAQYIADCHFFRGQALEARQQHALAMADFRAARASSLLNADRSSEADVAIKRLEGTIVSLAVFAFGVNPEPCLFYSA